MMERRHALNAARNVLDSKIAKALLEENKLPHRNLKLRVERLKSDKKRSEALYENQQRQFRKHGLLYNFDPSIVVERPPSRESSPPADESDSKTPHYMTDLKKNRQHPITLSIPKVDAFKVARRKKKNLWEQNITMKDMNEQFRSIILKSPPLTSEEQCDLDKGWVLYRPVSRCEESMREMFKSKTKNRRRLAKTVKPKVTSSSEVFITQLVVDKDIHVELPELNNTQTSASNVEVSALLQEKLRSHAVAEINEEKLQQFKNLRERQRRSYHQYLK